MKTCALLIVTCGMIVLTGCAAEQKGDRTIAPCEAGSATVVFNITSGPDHPHPVTMALQLAGHALDDDRRVVLFFNVKGVAIPTKQLSPALAYHDKPIKGLLAKLMERGAIVLVCPHCMKAESIAADQLVEGAQVADREKLFGRIGGNTVVFTY